MLTTRESRCTVDLVDAASYELQAVSELHHALTRPKNLIQILTGPRQVGKSTAALQLQHTWDGEVRYASADSPVPPGAEWVTHQWNLARRAGSTPLLIIDEVQKVPGWSETVKSLWDEDRREDRDVRVLLLGSSALLMHKGLSESLSGRFFLHRLPHWQYPDMTRAFDMPLERWLYFGGYPGAVSFTDDEARWRSYVRDSLIETVLARDVLQVEPIAKPALLRHLFMLSTAYPAQILSYNKMLGQLTEAGNAVGLRRFLDRYPDARPFIVGGSGMPLEKFFSAPLHEEFSG
jgi:uncharacterized protein